MHFVNWKTLWDYLFQKPQYNTSQSVNGPTPGDNKLQKPIEHTISDR